MEKPISSGILSQHNWNTSPPNLWRNAKHLEGRIILGSSDFGGRGGGWKFEHITLLKLLKPMKTDIHALEKVF